LAVGTVSHKGRLISNEEIIDILLDKYKSPHVVAIQLRAVYLDKVKEKFSKEEAIKTFEIYNSSDQKEEYGEKAYRYYEIWDQFFNDIVPYLY
jgi:ribosomal protein S24E